MAQEVDLGSRNCVFYRSGRAFGGVRLTVETFTSSNIKYNKSIFPNLWKESTNQSHTLGMPATPPTNQSTNQSLLTRCWPCQRSLMSTPLSFLPPLSFFINLVFTPYHFFSNNHHQNRWKPHHTPLCTLSPAMVISDQHGAGMCIWCWHVNLYVLNQSI